jgi:hypothetical protein
MRTLTIIVCVLVVAIGAAWAADAGKVTLDAKNMAIKDAVADLAKQAQVSIVLDPKATGNINVSLTNVDLSQALDVMSKMNKLTWKKLRFAKSQDDAVKLEQIKAAILALATMPMIGVQLEDPATKQSTLFAKNLPSAPDTANVKLPEGYEWTTIYVVLAAEPEKTAAAPADKDKVTALAKAETDLMTQMATLTPEQRQQVYATEFMAQMNLTPEARQALIKDRFAAMNALDPQTRDQLHQDMRTVFHDMRPPGGGQGGNGQGGRHHQPQQ